MSTLRQAWWLGSFVLLAFAGGAHAAGTLQDPTRPAIGMPTAGPADSTGTAATELQSILHQPGRKPRALIGGQWLEQGQLWGDLRVVKIKAASVILQQVNAGKAGERQELKLTPGIEKTPPAKQPVKRAVEPK